MEERENSVNITYSAQDQREVDTIRAKYLPKSGGQPSRLEQLKRLDKRVENKALIAGLSSGILSTLVLGGGLSLVLSMGQPVIGILLGVIGLAGMLITPLLHQRVLKKEREKAAPEILRLSEEEPPISHHL